MFYDELKFRLDFLIDNKDSQASRVRCLRAVAVAAKRLVAEHNHHGMLNYLVDYCQKVELIILF